MQSSKHGEIEKHGGKLTNKQKKERLKAGYGAEKHGEKHGGKLTGAQLNGKMEGGAIMVSIDQLTVYQCGYCNAKKESKSTGNNGRIRMRCGYGGKQGDNAARMHTKWIPALL